MIVHNKQTERKSVDSNFKMAADLLYNSYSKQFIRKYSKDKINRQNLPARNPV